VRSQAAIFRWLTSALVFAIVACGGGSMGPVPGSSSNAAVDICNCTASEPASSDYRHDAKHVGLPGPTGQTVSVADILAWEQGPSLPADAPRNGRELVEFLIPHAWLQFAWEVPGDCDLHLEISDVPDKTAPRVIVETPLDREFCPARRTIQQQLATHGFVLNGNSGELPAAVPVQVLGLAFQDFEHQRGSQFVRTVWEIHPAIVTLIGQ
jgi:hypothetical protein